MHRDNWDDLRFVLAVADSGSVSAAARNLGVNHATVLRRVAGFEDRLNTALFERNAKGYRVPPDRMQVVTALREVQDSILAVERVLKGATEPLRGELNVTSTDTFCQKVLPEIIAGFSDQAPDLRINLVCTNAHVDFDRLSADITVRPAGQLADGLFGDVACNLGFGVFKRKGTETNRWHDLQGPLAGSLPAKWMRETLPTDQIIQGADSFLVLKELAVFGAGMSILPHFIGREDPRLIEIPDIMPDTNIDIWVASHSDLKNSPRIRAGQAMLLVGIKQQALRLGGL
ncbi:MAG: LysR family transcriptional regulator [Rhodobacteraceae bacterium]|nr:LysR family transcriptional regulator [Paracoccaceae bacterium]